MPFLCWEPLFSMLCMDNWHSLNLYLMISGSHVVIRIMLMSIYVNMYLCMSLYDMVIEDHDCLMLMFICMYVCMSLSDRVVRDRSCGGMISYGSEWHEGVRRIKCTWYPKQIYEVNILWI